MVSERAFKTEINPTAEQKKIIRQSLGVCRYLFNLFLFTNFERLKQGKRKRIMSGFDFDKYVNNELSLEKPWIKKTCGAKARKKAIMNADKAFREWFKGKKGKPKFKKKQNQEVGVYFPKNNKTDLIVKRHAIKVPTLKFVRLKEKGYIPTKAQVVNCVLKQKADRFFISVTVNIPDLDETAEHASQNESVLKTEGIGMDVGLKSFVVTSNNDKFANVNKTPKIKKEEKKLKRAQRALSRKLEHKKKRGEESATDSGSNINKNILRVQKIHFRLSQLRKTFREEVVDALVKTKPKYITTEKLNVKGMMRNRHLSKAIADSGFSSFKTRLLDTCRRVGIELREVNLFYPSSKLCSCCGYKKKKLTLAERIFRCDNCSYENDRDLNAAINLKLATEYTVLT